MPPTPENLNLRRRKLPALLARAAGPLLKPLLVPFRKPRPGAPATVFASYMVGDFFMALPALRRLAAAMPVEILCRPDCLPLLRSEGLAGRPFDNAFHARPGPRTFFSNVRAALALRGRLGPVALDLDADPRSAFWLKLAGAARVMSYRRAPGVLFDQTFPLPRDSVHQADRDLRVAEEFLRLQGQGAAASSPPPPEPARGVSPADASAPWLLSVWTRKASKNWPLRHWDVLLERMLAEGIPFEVIDPPDGDAGFRTFRERWKGRVSFAAGSLPDLAERVRSSAGAVATDNFLGHMAGYYGRPVLWINICSPAAQVEPRGPRTLRAQAPDPRDPASLSPDEVWNVFRKLRG